MDKIKCLGCEKEFEPVRSTAKFCSVKCRVKHFRKHGKKDEIKPYKVQILLNEFRGAIDEFKDLMKSGSINYAPTPPNGFDGAKFDKVVHDESLSFDTLKKPFLKPQRSFDSYRQARIDCESQEQWEALKEEILNDAYLSTKQKSLLTT